MRVGSKIGRVAVGHPVDVASGAFFEAPVDATFTGVVPLRVRRWYNTSWLERPVLTPAAQDSDELPFGVGWRACWQYELRQTLEGYTFEAPDGTVVSFRAPRATSTPTLIAPGDGLELSRRPDGTIVLTSFGFDRSPTSLLFTPGRAGYDFFGEERTAQARMTVERDPWGRAIALVQRREQRVLQIDYDPMGRVATLSVRYPGGATRMLRQFGYDSAGHLVSVHDADGALESYGYDDRHRMIESRSRRGSLYTMRYDSRDRCIYVSGSGHYQERVLSWHDPARRAVIRNSHGAETTYDFNEAGQVIAETMPSGDVTRFEFDAEGRLASCANAWGAIGRVEYDGIGRIVGIHRPDGSTARYEHDDQHRLVEYVSPDGHVYRVERTHDHGASRVWVPGTTKPWIYESNEWGEILRATDPLGATRSNGYDACGNVIWTTDWNGHVHRYEYDMRGARTAHIDPLGQRTDYTVDIRDDLVAIRFPDGRVHQRAFSLDRSEQTYTLPDGRRSFVRTNPCGGIVEAVDEDGNATHFHWDTEPGKLLGITNPRGDTFEFRYDDDGRHIEVKTFDGRVQHNAWKGALLTHVILPDGGRIDNAFDVFGRVIEQRRPDGKTEYEYDVSHRPTSIKSTDAVLTFTYDERGNCVAENQDGIVVRRGYDAVRNLRSFGTSLGDETQIDVDGNGDYVALRRSGTEIKFIRDPLGREVQRHLPGAGTLYHWWDPIGRMTAQRLIDGAETTLMERSFSYDRVGVLAGLRDSLRGEFAFAHDGRTNLTAVLRPSKEAELYVYGMTGNRLGEAVVTEGVLAFEQARAYGSSAVLQRRAHLRSPTTQHNVASGDRLLDTSVPGCRVSYEYDGQGRVVKRTRGASAGASVWGFEWDSLGCLRRAVLPDGKAWTYRYDGLRRRLSKTSPAGETTRYVWDKFQIAYEIAPNGKHVAWVYADTGGPLLMDDGSLHLVVADQVGAPMEVVSPKGVLEDVVSKGTWGENFQARLVRQPFLGQWFDEETGLHYNVFRYYDPETGRYLTPDPVSILGGHNLYTFVASSVELVDPWGLYSYDQLRARSPTDDIRNSIQHGSPPQTCPVLGTQHDRLDADHIVPLRTITEMPGFNKLTDAQQLAIANMPDNFIGVGKNANSSRQHKSWADWEKKGGHSEHGTGDQDFLDHMKEREKALRDKIQAEIDKAHSANAACGGAA